MIGFSLDGKRLNTASSLPSVMTRHKINAAASLSFHHVNDPMNSLNIGSVGYPVEYDKLDEETLFVADDGKNQCLG